jgi:hypothetical protein
MLRYEQNQKGAVSFEPNSSYNVLLGGYFDAGDFRIIVDSGHNNVFIGGSAALFNFAGGFAIGSAAPSKPRISTSGTFGNEVFAFMNGGNAYAPVEAQSFTPTSSQGTTPAWFKVSLTSVEDGNNGCASAMGCWRVRQAMFAKAGVPAQDIALFRLYRGSYVSAIRAKAETTCSGPKVIQITGFGNDSNRIYYASDLAYDLTARVQDTNILNVSANGSEGVAGGSVWTRIVVGGGNVDQIAAGCTVDFWILAATLPQ